MASGIPYLGAPFMAAFVRRYQRYRYTIIWVGWPLCILGLVAGSFADSVGALIVTQGVMYGCESYLNPSIPLARSSCSKLQYATNWF